VAFHPDGKQVISSGLEPALYWWDAATGQRTRLQRGHREAVHELTFSADGKALASAGGDGIVRLWDPARGALRRTISVGSLVYAVALSPDGKTVAAGTFDGLVRLYDAGSGQHRATLLSVESDKGGPAWLALTPQGHVAGSESLRGQGRWLMGRQEVAGAKAWQAVLRPDILPRALRGEKLSAPSFTK
jgi:WD40 repeat protein